MIRNHFIYIIFSFLWLAAFPAWAEASLSIAAENGQEMITISLPGSPHAHVFTLQHPERLVVDVSSLPRGTRIEMPKDYRGSLIKGVRLGRFDAKTSRIVFDLAAAPAGMQTRIRKQRLTITLSTSGSAAAKAPPQKTAAKPAPVVLKQTPKKKEKPLIVIDAGHGGQDPGTIGRGGTQEKSVTLDFARSLRKALLATGHFRVLLTRDDDRFILLHGRVDIARKARADMFVSLHADSAPDETARGLSLYTLSEKASDAEAQALAERENKVDVVYGLDLAGQSKDVADILLSLAQRDTNNHSATLAETLTNALVAQGVHLLVNSHRFAGFAVLKAPDIPSVLVETGFLSNLDEEKQLRSKIYREKVAKGLAKGIDTYFAGKAK